MLALCSLLQLHTGDAIEAVINAWADLCRASACEPVQFSEAWHLQDKKKNYNRVKALINTSLDLGSFPSETPQDIVVVEALVS